MAAQSLCLRRHARGKLSRFGSSQGDIELDRAVTMRATSAVKLILSTAAGVLGIADPVTARADEAMEHGPALTPSA
jgi:hypothetical protein